MPAESRESPGGRLAIAAGLVLATALVYWPVTTFRFVGIDDVRYVFGNPHVLGGLTAENVAWAFTSFHASNWHPLTWLSLMLDAELGGPGPVAFHRTNLLLHAAGAVALFLALSRITRTTWRSALVAGLFAVHPLHVESVAWVSERKDVLSTLLWWLTLLAWARYVERPGVGRYLVAAGVYALGLLAKPMLVTLPLTLVLLDLWPLRRLEPGPTWAGVWRSLREKLPLLALAAASCTVTLLAQTAGGALRSIDKFPPALRLANAALAYVGYLGKTVWPARLSVLYPYDRDPGWAAPLAAVVLLAGISVVALKLARSRPYATVGWLWYVGTLVPVIGLVQVGEEPMADRYTYLPLVGVFVVVVWGVPDLLERLGATGRSHRVALAAAAAIALAALGVAARTQVGVWRDSETLFGHALEVDPSNTRARIGLAVHRLEQGRVAEAVDHLRAALRVDPDNTSALANLATALLRAGEPDEAVALYRRALALRPADHDVHANLGIALTRRGDFDDAEAAFEEALRLAPDYTPAHAGFGALLARRRDDERAVVHLERAVTAGPADAGSRLNLAIVLDRLGRSREAESQLREVLRRDPRRATAHKRLGRLLARRGALDEAIAAFTESLRLDPDQPGLREDLRRVREFRDRGRPPS